VAETLAIETIGLIKTYNGVPAVQGLDLRVPQGAIFGLLGLNGAGKTSTIKMLLGMSRPTSGGARVFGLDAASRSDSVTIRLRTGFVSEDKDLYDPMTVEQLVRFTASFYPQWRKHLEARYLRAFELPPDRTVADLSRGMRTKLALLLALSRGAELLILDEPTSGLDPAGTEEVLQALVTQAGSDGTTVLLSSHRLSDVDQIADHVAIIDRGRAVVSGALEDLRYSYRRLQLVFDGEAPQTAFQTQGVIRSERRGRVLTMLCRGSVEAVLSEARGLNPVSVEILPVNLKEMFLETVHGEN
jgi:ABC-2 type transport system ATP-binding protein